MGKFYFQLEAIDASANSQPKKFNEFNTLKTQMIALGVASEESFKEVTKYTQDNRFVYQIFTFEDGGDFSIACINPQKTQDPDYIYMQHWPYELRYKNVKIAWSLTDKVYTNGTRGFEIYPANLQKAFNDTAILTNNPPIAKTQEPLPPITALPECIIQLLNRFSSELRELLKASLDSANTLVEIYDSFDNFKYQNYKPYNERPKRIMSTDESYELRTFLLNREETDINNLKKLITEYLLPPPVLQGKMDSSNVSLSAQQTIPQLQLDKNIIIQLDEIIDKASRFEFLQNIDFNTLKTQLEKDNKTLANVLYKLDNNNGQRLVLFLKNANIITNAQSLGSTLKAIGSDSGTEENVKAALEHVKNRLKGIEGTTSAPIPLNSENEIIAILANIDDESKKYFLEEVLEPSHMLQGLRLESFLHYLPQPRTDHIIQALSNGASIQNLPPDQFLFYMQQEELSDQYKIIEFLLNPNKLPCNTFEPLIKELLNASGEYNFIQTFQEYLSKYVPQQIVELISHNSNTAWDFNGHGKTKNKFLIELSKLINAKEASVTFSSCINQAYNNSGCAERIVNTGNTKAFLEMLSHLDQIINLPSNQVKIENNAYR